jgi:hypothetical protein
MGRQRRDGGRGEGEAKVEGRQAGEMGKGKWKEIRKKQLCRK